MKTRRFFRTSTALLLCILLGLFAPIIGHCQTATQGETPNFNPDPGATLRTSQPTFYQPPPGTTPDYDKPRDPLLDKPHAPLVPLQPLPMGYQLHEMDYDGDQLPPYTKAVPDRWQFHVYTNPPGDAGLLAIPIWKRYNEPEHETPYGYDNTGLFDPYKQSLLKGDLPVANQDTFLAITGNSFTAYEARDIPTPAGVSTANAESSQFYGAGNQQEVDQFLSLDINLFQGETAFQPISWQVLFQPVYNINYTEVKQTGALSVDPRGSGLQSDNSGVFTNTVGVQSSTIVQGLTPVQIAGLKPGNPSLSTALGGPVAGGVDLQHVGAQSLNTSYITRTKDFVALQEAFGEVKLADLTPNYDFVSLRVGNQPFISDFRGFIFDDTDLGARLFGNYDSNRWQYNLAVFDMRQKDTYSDLNTFDSRHQWVFAANVYRQDFFAKGYTAQLSFLTDFDNQTTHFDRTGNQVDPEVLGGPIEPHDVRAYYFGWNGDGHIGRFNITHSFYEVVGHDDDNSLAGHGVDINAQMGALELSYDESWIRFKASFFYGSGDDKPTSNTATGFDSIMDNPEFAGGPFSYFVRQGFIFGDTSVAFKQRNSLLFDLRSSKTEGQANFVNPGVLLYGIGSDIDLAPTAKLFLNANYIQLATNESVNYALHTDNIGRDIGWDLSGGVKYRPLLTNNIILSAGLGALVPANAYKRIYSSNTTEIPGYDTIPENHVDSFLYSGFASVTLTY